MGDTLRVAPLCSPADGMPSAEKMCCNHCPEVAHLSRLRDMVLRPVMIRCV